MVAALSTWHHDHESAAAALEAVQVLPAHVLMETYAVLTRLPSGLAVPPELAAGALSRRFRQPPLRLGKEERREVLALLAAAGVSGGATYDGLVALEARAGSCTLLTLDERAQSTYRRLGVDFRLITP